tara:strand:- start:16064 stop:16654 length:591 start_codon:yes stop_codon:yes gene_type:complete
MYESHKFADIEILPGDVTIDCGANVGLVTEVFKSAGAQVYAFEPNQHAFDILKKKYQNTPGVHCIQKGVSSSAKTGKAKLFLHENANEDQVVYSTGSSTNPDKSNVDTDNYLEIELIDLCAFIRNLGMPIKVLKIDIEGAEIELLNSMIDEGVIQDIPYVLVETHEKKIVSLREPTRLLKERIERENLKNIDLTWR